VRDFLEKYGEDWKSMRKDRGFYYVRTEEGQFAFYGDPGECLFTCDQVAILYDSMRKDPELHPVLLRHGPVERIEREAWLMKKKYRESKLLLYALDLEVLVLPKDIDPDKITWILDGTGRLGSYLKEISGE